MDSNTDNTKASARNTNQSSSHNDTYAFPPLPGMMYLSRNTRESGSEKHPRSSRSLYSSRRTMSRSNDFVDASATSHSASDMHQGSARGGGGGSSRVSRHSSREGGKRHCHSGSRSSYRSKRHTTSRSNSFSAAHESDAALVPLSRTEGRDTLPYEKNDVLIDDESSIGADEAHTSSHHTLPSRACTTTATALSRSGLHSSEHQPSSLSSYTYVEVEGDSEGEGEGDGGSSNHSAATRTVTTRPRSDEEDHAVVSMEEEKSDASLRPLSELDAHADTALPSTADRETSLPHETDTATSRQSLSAHLPSELPPMAAHNTQPLSSAHLAALPVERAQRTLSSRRNSAAAMRTPLWKDKSISMRDYNLHPYMSQFGHSAHSNVSDVRMGDGNTNNTSNATNTSTNMNTESRSNLKESHSESRLSRDKSASMMSQRTLSNHSRQDSAVMASGEQAPREPQQQQKDGEDEEEEEDDYTYISASTQKSQSELNEQEEDENEKDAHDEPPHSSTLHESAKEDAVKSASSSHISRHSSHRQPLHSSKEVSEQESGTTRDAEEEDEDDDDEKDASDRATRLSDADDASTVSASHRIGEADDAARQSAAQNRLSAHSSVASTASLNPPARRRVPSRDDFTSAQNGLPDSATDTHMHGTAYWPSRMDAADLLGHNALAHGWNAVDGRDGSADPVPPNDPHLHDMTPPAQDNSYVRYEKEDDNASAAAPHIHVPPQPNHRVSTVHHSDVLNIGEVETLIPLPFDALHPMDKFFINFDEATQKTRYRSQLGSGAGGGLDEDSPYGSPMNEDEMLLEQFAEFTDDDSLYSNDGADVRQTISGRRGNELDFWEDEKDAYEEDEGMRLGSLHGLGRAPTNKPHHRMHSGTHHHHHHRRHSRHATGWISISRKHVPPPTVYAALNQNSCVALPYGCTSACLRYGYAEGNTAGHASQTRSKQQQQQTQTQAAANNTKKRKEGLFDVIGRYTSRAFDDEWLYQVHRNAVALDHSSFFIFKPRSVTRVVIYNLLHHSMMELFVFVSILAYTVFQACWDRLPASPDVDLVKPDYMFFADIFFTMLLAMECTARLYVNGAVLHPHAYFRNWWRWLDTVVLVCMILACTSYPVLWNYTAWRLLRAIKCLTYRPMPTGMRMVAKTVLRSTNQLLHVMGYMFFFVLFFALVGMQVFGGRMHYQCVNTITGKSTGHLCRRPHQYYWWLWLTGHECGPLHECRGGFDNPTFGYGSFDDVGHSILAVFQIITQQSWVSLLYQTDQTTTHVSVLYFILAIVMLSWIIAPLSLGVYFEKLCRSSRLHTLRQLEFFSMLLHEQRQRMTALVRLHDYVERDGAGRVSHYPTYHTHTSSRSPGTVYQANSAASASRGGGANTSLALINVNNNNNNNSTDGTKEEGKGPLYVYGVGVDVDAVARMVRRRRIKRISWADAQRIQLQLSLTRQHHLVQYGDKLRRDSTFPQSGRAGRGARRLPPAAAAHSGQHRRRRRRSRSHAPEHRAGTWSMHTTSPLHRHAAEETSREDGAEETSHTATFALGGSVGAMLHHFDNATRGGADDGSATFAARQEAVIADDLRFMHPAPTPRTWAEWGQSR